MDKYKNLMSNTLIFAVATFGSKLLPFVLLRFYTTVLPTDAFGVQALVTSACNLILPLMYLSMGEAVIRFGLDSHVRKSDVFTVGILTVFLGYGVLLLCMPLLGMVSIIKEYLWLIYLYVIASATHTVAAQFARASGFVRIFALDGIFTTLMTVLMNILLLVKFKMGAQGYVLSIIIADALSAILLTLILKLYKYFKIRGLDLDVARAMLRYSIPLVPTAVFWWVTSLSGRFFIRYMVDESAVGIYTVAQTLPNLIMLVSLIFTQAWQLSAFTEYKTPEGEKFFSNVFKSYYTFVLLAASGLILLCKPILAVLTASGYHDAWHYTPFLVLAVAFSTLVTFLGIIYNAVQKNAMVMFTTFIGAACNFSLNFAFVPKMGLQGAAIATFASYFVVFLIRAVDSRKYINLHIQPLRIALTVVLLIVQAYVGIKEIKLWPLWESLIFAALVAGNFKYIWFLLRRLLEMAGIRKAAEN